MSLPETPSETFITSATVVLSGKVDPLDERTKYYCEKDVERHLRSWRSAAAEKRMRIFELPLDNPTMYLPERFDMWRTILQQGGQL